MRRRIADQGATGFEGCMQALQIVDGPGVYRAGRGYYAGRPKSHGAIFGNGLAQRCKVDAQSGICRNAPQRSMPESQRLHRLAMAAVKLIGSIKSQRLLNSGDAELADIDASLSVACHS